MRIQHNIMAMNAYNQYNKNTKALSANLEKLSSGYKINRAGDDAAGLAISEKMRAQITNLDAAQKNVKDGTSLVKTAEGAMQEIHDMLNKMSYLATQSANGTYQDEVDRENLNKEMESLKSEINRIADSANFNGIKLLDGSLDPVAKKAADAEIAAEATSAVTVTALVDHEDKPEAKKMKFSLDLSSLQVGIKGTSTDQTVTITTGLGVTITTTATSAGTMGAFSISTVTQVSIGSVTFNVTLNGNKLEFEMAANPTSAWNTALTAVSFATNTYLDVNMGHSLEYHIEQAAVAGGKTVQAQGHFSLTDDMVKDGAELTIGDTTYTFAVGKDSKYKDAANVVDLTDIETVDTAALNTAAARLSGVATDKGDFLVTSNANSARIDLTERVGDNSAKDYELVGPTTTTANDATWKNVVSYSTAESRKAAEEASTSDAKGALTLQIGDTADTFNRMDVGIGDMHVSAMGTMKKGSEPGTYDGVEDGKSIADIDILTAESAGNAIDVIKGAINYVSSIRGDLGAIQNRLDHTGNNLAVMQENIQDAESTIRDTDVAEEMMKYVKNNILVQSAQAMLAQANQVPQGVLQLLG